MLPLDVVRVVVLHRNIKGKQIARSRAPQATEPSADKLVCLPRRWKPVRGSEATEHSRRILISVSFSLLAS